jgi:hypothetical protein
MTNIIAMALAAVLAVESQNGADKRTGDGGRAVGAFQMWPVAVQEANRIESIMARREGRRPRKWRVSDRVDIDRSMEMCEVTMVWHYRRGVTDPVELACRWRNPYSACPEWHRRKIEKAVKKGMKK